MLIKKSWEEVSCRDYFEFLTDIQDEEIDETERDILRLMLSTNLTYEEVESKTRLELLKIAKQVEWVLKEPTGGKMAHEFPLTKLGDFIAIESHIEKKEPLKTLALISEGFQSSEPITKHIGALNQYYFERDKFLKSNQSNFEQAQEEAEIEQESNQSNFEQAQEEAKVKAQKPHSWTKFVYALANEDITKMQAVLDLPIAQVFNVVNMKKAFEN